MPKNLYTSLEGPKGTVEIYEVNSDEEGISVRPDSVWYEVRFQGQNLKFWQEGEAAATAYELAGLEF